MKLGFIGCGNMASAIIGGILEKEIAGREDINGLLYKIVGAGGGGRGGGGGGGGG